MEVIIVEDAEEVGRVAGGRIAEVVGLKPTAVIGLATGSSPSSIYRDLHTRVRAGEIAFDRASGFALDEYVGIGHDHPQSYENVIARDIVAPLGFNPRRVHVPNGRAEDLSGAAKEYDEAIAHAGGIDIQILGIGTNGHIGFNEPMSSFASRTRVKMLASQTRTDNARFFHRLEDVPVHCITQGLGTILEARALVLVAHGDAKAAAIAAAVEGPLTSFIPASALQLHRHATVIVDESAASKLKMLDYYRDAYANKPAA